MNLRSWNRRQVLAAGGALSTLPLLSTAEESRMLTRPIPGTSDALPVIGLGTYSVFDVAGTPEEIEKRREIVELLTAAGGSVVDTSPMYRRSEKVIGDVIAAANNRDDLFIATKVWTDGGGAGIAQMQRSSDLMHAKIIDLMQVHNLRDTDVHMNNIREWQKDRRIRYSGLTHYNAGGMDALENEMRKHRPDFIQINYSLGEREAENRILPLAEDLGIGVLINRPYQSGALFRSVADRELPEWAADFAASWGQFFLKFIISHPAVTCAIPATSKPRNMRDNLQAGFGPLPDKAMRQRMQQFFSEL